MASTLAAAFAILVALAVATHSARGAAPRLSCEELPPDVCAFAVSSGGLRCVLERTPEGAHRCQTSAVAAGAAAAGGWVETDACVRACGADRAALGLPVASAAAEDRRAIRALCSPACRDGCPNVVDLYATVAAAEGMSLPAMCEAQKSAGSRRMMMGGGMAPVGAPMMAPAAAPVASPPVVASAPCEEPPVVAPPPCDEW
ncbi:unnamed protein product [Urochloa decumbens]|uniref:PAR1 protein n=1 Tax=Urochloa decumbens TaxID=240449 RepID=A0ABC9GGV9_9POAL